ncbi:hypothetical protein VKT23_015841 [Stygiomarasmius scandens]|uniref:DUF6534 domain-containing protein n=1 Tax=Marasmiellus scandens TaxID=2682957 RepID=A0ABR1IZU9_9AGAR
MSSSDSLQVTLGGLQVSVLIATFIYAVSCFQAFLYWRSRFSDRLGVRILVWVVWLFETTHTLCFWFYLFTITVKYYGVPEELEQRHWSITMSIVFHGLITGCVQSYYSYRVYILSGGRKLIPIMCWIGCLIEGCGSVGIAVVLYHVGPVVFAANWELFPTLNIAVDLSVGVVNTTTLCYYLLQRKTGIKSTDQIVSTLIEWSVESGLITALAALGMLIACVVTPNTAVYLSMTSFYAKFYSNSLLASLNGRGPFSPFRIFVPPNTLGNAIGTELQFAVNTTQATETSSPSINLSQSMHQLPRSSRTENVSQVKSKTSAHGMQLTSIAERDTDLDSVERTRAARKDEDSKDAIV